MTAFRFIAAEKANHPISVMCQMLGVSRSGYHAWSTRPPSDRALTDAWLIEKIKQIHAENRQVYGAPRVHAELRMAQGIRVGRKRVERLMRTAGLSGLIVKRKGRTTIRVPGVRVADDLVQRDFRPAAPDVLWVADITYLRTWQGWLYLAAVQDAYSRQIVGWAMADHMRTELVVDALTMAVNRRRPDAGLIHHSDQGSQYVSLGFGQLCAKTGLAVDGIDQGVLGQRRGRDVLCDAQEELVYRRSWPTRNELISEIFEFVTAFYNRTRRPSTRGMLSPVQFEEGPRRSPVSDPR